MHLQHQDLLFDEELHLYTWKGAPVRSVTQVLGVVGVRDGKGNWSPLGFDDRWIFDNTAAEFGTAFHKVASIILSGKTAVYPEVMTPWVNSFYRFLEDYQPEPFLDVNGNPVIEYLMYSPLYKYAGTPDYLCTIGNDIYLLDWKTSTADSHHWGYQLAGYERLIKEVLGVRKKINRMTVRFSDTGYLVKPWKDPSDWSIFQSALNLSRLAA